MPMPCICNELLKKISLRIRFISFAVSAFFKNGCSKSFSADGRASGSFVKHFLRKSNDSELHGSASEFLETRVSIGGPPWTPFKNIAYEKVGRRSEHVEFAEASHFKYLERLEGRCQRLAAHQFVDDHSQAKDVNLGSVLLSSNHLRSHPIRRAYHVSGVLDLIEINTQSKIN